MIYEMYYQIFTAILNTLSSRGHSFSCIYYQFKIHFDSHTLVSCNRPNLVTKILKVFCVVLFSYILSMYWFLWPTFVRVLKIFVSFFLITTCIFVEFVGQKTFGLFMNTSYQPLPFDMAVIRGCLYCHRVQIY